MKIKVKYITFFFSKDYKKRLRYILPHIYLTSSRAMILGEVGQIKRQT